MQISMEIDPMKMNINGIWTQERGCSGHHEEVQVLEADSLARIPALPPASWVRGGTSIPRGSLSSPGEQRGTVPNPSGYGGELTK